MMKLCLCFLVLAISSTSRGQNETASSVNRNEDPPSVTTTPPSSAEALNEAASTMAPTPSPLSYTSENATNLFTTANTTQKEESTSTSNLVSKTTEEVDGGAAAHTTASVSSTWDGRGGIDETASTSSEPVTIEAVGHSSWGYVILVLIILVIIVLCVILFFLRRVSRTYSFDLHRHVPTNHLNEPIGTFEPVYLDDLDRPAAKDQVTTADLSPPPVTNGTTLQPEERASNGESDPQKQTEPNGLETSPTSNTSPSLDDDPADKTPSPLSSSNLFFDTIGEEQQNENNNNPSVCSSDPFVEINLDDPAWCDQLLASTGAPSSVLPFSPFSFSSSSSSSS